MRAGHEVAVGVGSEHRDVEHVLVRSCSPSISAACFLVVAQVAMPGVLIGRSAGRQVAAEQLAGRDRARRRMASLVLPQERLMRRVRGVGLALVDPGRVGVRASWMSSAVPRMPSGPGWFLPRVSTMNRRFAGARSSVLPRMWSGPGDQRVVILQRDEDRAAALDRLVDAMVEELAEQGEQRVVRRGEADVGRDVRDEQRLVGRRASGGTASTGGLPSGSGSVVHGTRPGCPGCAPGNRPRRWRPGWSRSDRRSGC